MEALNEDRKRAKDVSGKGWEIDIIAVAGQLDSSMAVADGEANATRGTCRQIY